MPLSQGRQESPRAEFQFRCIDLEFCCFPGSSLCGVRQTGEISAKLSHEHGSLQTCVPFIISFDPHSNWVLLLYSLQRKKLRLKELKAMVIPL